MAKRLIAVCCIALGALAPATLLAQATGPQRTFVASYGNDTQPCSRVLPCRQFGAAIATVAPGGEVVVLDSAGYGPATIAKAVSIIAPAGIYAGISAFSGNGIEVSGGASDIVVLRGLTIVGLGANYGIYSTLAGTLRVENCVISGMAAAGIASITSGKAFITDTIVRNNFDGIDLGASGTPGVATLERVRANDNTNGIWVTNANASMHDSEASGNSFGVIVGSFTMSDNPVLNVESSVISNNSGPGIQGANAAGKGTFSVANSSITNNGNFGINGGVSDLGRVANSTITGNVSGVGTAIVSVGGNLVEGNSFNNTFTTTVSKK